MKKILNVKDYIQSTKGQFIPIDYLSEEYNEEHKKEFGLEDYISIKKA